MKFDLADKTNRDIQEKVEKGVDARITDHATEKNEDVRAFLTFAGSGRYGSVEDPREGFALNDGRASEIVALP
jgi:hypothetical protein